MVPPSPRMLSATRRRAHARRAAKQRSTRSGPNRSRTLEVDELRRHVVDEPHAVGRAVEDVALGHFRPWARIEAIAGSTVPWNVAQDEREELGSTNGHD